MLRRLKFLAPLTLGILFSGCMMHLVRMDNPIEPTLFSGQEAQSCATIASLTQTALSHDYREREMTPALVERINKELLRRLDRYGLFFLAADQEKIKGALSKSNLMESDGVCSALREISQLHAARANGFQTEATALLQNAYPSLSSTAQVLFPDWSGYPIDKSAQTQHRKAYLSTHIAAYSKMGLTRQSIDENLKGLIQTKSSPEQSTVNRLAGLYVRSFFHVLDGVSSVSTLPPQNETCLGVYLRKDRGAFRVVHVGSGLGFEKQVPVSTGESIFGFTSKEGQAELVYDIDESGIRSFLCGPPGSSGQFFLTQSKSPSRIRSVKMTLPAWPSKEEMQDFTTEKNDIAFEGKHYKIAVINIKTMNLGFSKRIKSTLKDLQGNTDAIVLNLENCQGGLFNEMVEAAGLFVERVPVGFIRDRSGMVTTMSPKQDLAYSGPLVVNTNESTASAAEVIAAALQDYRRAVVVGRKVGTFGAGVAFALTVKDGLIVKLASGVMFRPNGKSIQGNGLQPDILVPGGPSQPLRIAMDGFGLSRYALAPETTTSLRTDGVTTEIPDRVIRKITSVTEGEENSSSGVPTLPEAIKTAAALANALAK